MIFLMLMEIIFKGSNAHCFLRQKGQNTTSFSLDALKFFVHFLCILFDRIMIFLPK
jgi:hypothetical protein